MLHAHPVDVEPADTLTGIIRLEVRNCIALLCLDDGQQVSEEPAAFDLAEVEVGTVGDPLPPSPGQRTE